MLYLNGNLVLKTSGALSEAYGYSLDSMLISYKRIEGVNVSEEHYTYDACGNRLSKETTEGKQYYVTEGSEIYVEKLNCESGDVVNFDQVLMLDSKVGNPYLTNVTVLGEVLKNGKNKKIKIFKYKCKDKSNRRKQGHRQPYTKIKITKING